MGRIVALTAPRFHGEGSGGAVDRGVRQCAQNRPAVRRRGVCQDFAMVTGMFAEGIVWHQPDDNRFSGTHRGAAAIDEMFGGMMTVTGAATLVLETKLVRSRLPSVGRSFVDAHEGRGDQSGHFGR
ncbi:hypothetical protein ACFY78_11745 [Streptomyces olindensis]|uniref:hypothetical protein n=1 Tax=Streptomyces olindensis TaxID=358823 RepID=UPI0036C9787B